VEPWGINEALTCAIVKMFFVIRHYYLRHTKFDTFQADIQQIKFFKPGASIAAPGFKRRNTREDLLEVIIAA
jgi:hypothetical protein